MARDTAFERGEMPGKLSVGAGEVTQVTKARTMKRLISTARWLFNTDAAIIDPSSVNAHGSTGRT